MDYAGGLQVLLVIILQFVCLASYSAGMEMGHGKVSSLTNSPTCLHSISSPSCTEMCRIYSGSSPLQTPLHSCAIDKNMSLAETVFLSANVQVSRIQARIELGL